MPGLGCAVLGALCRALSRGPWGLLDSLEIGGQQLRSWPGPAPVWVLVDLEEDGFCSASPVTELASFTSLQVSAGEA